MDRDQVNRDIYSLGSGFMLGMLSWAIVPFMSESFEPFDSELAFYLGQSLLSIVAFLIGCSFRVRHVFIYLLGLYASNNAYPYLFGSSESRAWAMLGLLTTIFLCIYPAIAGMLGAALRVIWSRFRMTNRS